MIMKTPTRPPNIARRGRYTRLPDPPKTIDMARFPHIARAHTILDYRYEHDPSTLVGGGGYLLRAPDIRRGFAVPACMVAFGVEAAEIINANGYAIAEVGKPPDFVLDIAAQTTGVRDYAIKRRIYRRLRAGECWRFDATGGKYHDAPLAGDILVDCEYRPIEIRRDPDGSLRGYSPALDLWLVWQDGALRFYDPETSEFLRDLSESAARWEELERAARIKAETRIARAEAARIEAERREAAAHHAEFERAARIKAEARAARAEAEIERLRRLLENPE